MTLAELVAAMHPAGVKAPPPTSWQAHQQYLSDYVRRKRMSASASVHHQARPARSFPEHRFPALPEPAHPQAVSVANHVIAVAMKLHDAVDTANADATLSAEGRQQRVAAITATARDQLARVDAPGDTLAGDMRIVVQARVDAQAAASRRTAPDPAMVPILTELLRQLGAADPASRSRAISQATAVLADQATPLAAKAGAISTAQAVALAPDWYFSPPLHNAADELAAAHRRAVAPEQAAAITSLDYQTRHIAELRRNAADSLRQGGVVGG